MLRSSFWLLLCGLLFVAVPVQAQRQPQPPEQVFAAAYKLYSDELLAQAIPAFHGFRQQFPDHLHAPEALFYQAQASLALGRETQAVALFEAFQQQYPAHPLAFEARVALGKYFYENGNSAQALATLARVLAEDPPDELAAKALYWMGESAKNQGDFEAALGYYTRAAEDYRGTETAPVAQYAVAFTRVQMKNYDEAARAFELLGARFPTSPYAKNIGLALAEVYYEIGDYRRAVNEIERRMPELGREARDRATFLLAESYNQLRDHPSAIVNYRRFTERNEDSPYYRLALYGLAWNYYFEETYQWAADNFARVHDGHEDDLAARAVYYEAVNRKRADEVRASLPLFEEVYTRWPDHDLADHALYERGVTLYQLRQWQDANNHFGQLVARYPDSDLVGAALNHRGSTFIALGQFDEALRTFNEAIEMDSAPPDLRGEIVFQKAWLLYRDAEYAEAAPAFLDLFENNPTSERRSEALFWAAESQFQLGNLARAEGLFQRYLRDYSGDPQTEAAHYALGWVFFKQAKYRDAIASFDAFLERYRTQDGYVPYRTDALLRLADSYYALKQYPEAIELYARVAAQGEDYALYQVGQAFYNAGDAFQAITTFRQLLEQYRASDWREEAQYSLGYLYFQNGNYDQAITEYRTLLNNYPQDPLAAKAQYSIGDALFNAGSFGEAIAAYRQVLTRYPNSPFAGDAAASLQYSYQALGQPERADAFIDSFATANPNSPLVDQLRFRQAEVNFQSGMTDEALAAFQQFVRNARNPELLPEAYYYLGLIYADRDQPREAETYLKQLLENHASSPRRPEAARRLGNVYLDQRRYRDALRTFESIEAMTGDPFLVAQARYGQGMALMSLGRRTAAEDLLQNAVQAAPDAPESIPALLGLARLYGDDGRLREAADLYRRIIDRSPDETGAEALYRLGELLYTSGDARGAATELSRMPTLFGPYTEWVARSLLLQARALLRLGQRGDAVRLYDRVMDEYPDTPFAETARQEKEAL